MRKKSLIPLLALAVSLGVHAGWNVVAPLEANDGKWALYMDDADVQKDGQRVRVSTLYDLPPTARLNVKDREVHSIRDRIELDCGKATYTSVGSTYIDGPMGKGDVVLALGPTAEEEIDTNGALAAIAKKACSAR
ncbi:MAG: hypothetical protein JSS56_00060 [Proteobacteria bacterium]|nr:hypothetical protein [Pseudomonadota bacterium]